jgi:hypothetical protein
MKKIIPFPYEGDLQDLVAFTPSIDLNEYFVIKFQGQVVNGNKPLHTSYGRAKASLRSDIFANFCQGHYWHRGKNNTFAKEKGWARNGGLVDKSRKEFKIMAEQMTEWLLQEKIFTIEKVNL